MIGAIATIFITEQIQQRMNRRVLAIMRAANGMTSRQVLKHRNCKHFGDLVYFWVQNDMRMRCLRGN